jgi:membrane protease YdiL (CAAX protease family)
MLSDKPWKAEAIARLLARVLVCVFLGSLTGSIIRFFQNAERGHTVLFLTSSACALACFSVVLILLGRPWNLETFGRYSAVLLACFYCGLLLTWWSGRWNPSASVSSHSVLGVLIAVFFFQGATLVWAKSFLREHEVGWAEAFGLNNRPGRALLMGVATAIVVLPVAWGLQMLFGALLEQVRIVPEEQQTILVLRATEQWTGRFAMGFVAILLVPAAEEILFRGILYPAICRRGYQRLGWYGTSILFAAIHFNLVSLVPLTVLALCLVWIYEKCGNLLASITAHSLFNAVNFAFLLWSQHVQT